MATSSYTEIYWDLASHTEIKISLIKEIVKHVHYSLTSHNKRSTSQ